MQIYKLRGMNTIFATYAARIFFNIGRFYPNILVRTPTERFCGRVESFPMAFRRVFTTHSRSFEKPNQRSIQTAVIPARWIATEPQTNAPQREVIDATFTASQGNVPSTETRGRRRDRRSSHQRVDL